MRATENIRQHCDKSQGRWSPWLWAAMLLSAAITGCDAPIDHFESDELFGRRLELTVVDDMTQPRQDAQQAVEDWFGTPDQPKWPQQLDSEDLLSLDLLNRAAGPISSDEEGRHTGLYREHCVVCHGVAGNGRGPSAALLNPYPRDFRLAKIKFKSTPSRTRASKEDLTRIIRGGVVGTSMPAFELLDDEDVEALVDYVIYLSVRGAVERALLSEAAYELDIEAGERIYDAELKQADPNAFEQQMAFIDEATTKEIELWTKASALENVEPTPPSGFPIVGTKLAEAQQEQVQNSIAHGEELFRGNVASCAFCHGQNATGDGQQNNYDDWTRDWTAMAGLNPQDLDELAPMLEAGALKPRNIQPRNLRRGIFRGGARPQDLYRRIVHGIEGTPMPAAPLKPDNPQGLSEEDVWDLVNYLLSLRESSVSVSDKNSRSMGTPAREASAGLQRPASNRLGGSRG